MNAVKVYKLAYGKEPREFYNLGMLRSDIVFDENDNPDLFTAAIPEYAMTLLRIERNQILAQSDWMANSDVTMTEQWRVYRQALRDITTQTPSLDGNGNLTGITWPIPPTD